MGRFGVCRVFRGFETMFTQLSWERRIQRAQQLAETAAHAREMLAFYLEILRWQQGLFERLSAAARKQPLTGAFESDHHHLLEQFASLLNLAREKGSPALAALADQLGADRDGWRDGLAAWWHGESDAAQSLFPRACLQPYLELLARTQTPPFDSRINAFEVRKLEVAAPHRVCPFCGRKPQLALLSDDTSLPGTLVDGAADGGRRLLMCGECLTIWPFQRIACPNCPEADPERLPYYAAEEFPNLRVECCDTCKHYLKSIDLTKDRRPVPPVDELAAIPLDLWAIEQNYVKIQPNLAGI
ncbi:MAG TPA: formate dehydrogenase accessory protein FdhE [Blastocatellia bacterium]|nr:formate dehydrogenase accessory protein FdhE [Blastocatellia bacterium]